MICHLIRSVEGIILFIQTTARPIDKYPVSKRMADVTEIRPRVAKYP